MLVLEGICVGALSGLVVVAYRFILEKAGILSKGIYSFLKHDYYYLPVWIIALIIMAFAVGLIIRKQPMTKGSGIPQVEGVLLRQLDMNWLKVLAGKFAGGILCIAGGLSLGREGPSIQLGAATGQGFAALLKRPKIEEKFIITGGASAGLAAAFNAPLSGVIFALEEVHKNFSPLILLTATSSAITADVISKEFFGMKPVLNFPQMQVVPLDNYLYLIFLGIILGIFGVLFNYVLVKTQKLYEYLSFIPAHFRVIIPFLIAIIPGLFLNEIQGGGHDLIVSLVKKDYLLQMLLLILIAKFLFTMISFGSGAPGGIFLPMLAIGALTGKIYGVSMGYIFHLNPEYVNNFIVLAMAGYFTAVVRAPITGIVLVTEMTGSFSHLLSVSIVCIIAYLTADIMKSKPVYEILLERILHDKGDSAFKGDEAVKVVLEVPVSMGASLEGKMIKEVKWPENCLLVGIRRGSEDIIPNGNTRIYAGDYIIALVDEKRAPRVKRKLIKMGSI